MAGGKDDRGALWVDGQFTVRLRGPGSEPGRIIRIRRPFALIGQIPGADIRIDDPAVDGRHALLLLDRKGVFGVDLLSRSGTRFAGARSDLVSSRLGPGDILEVAGRRIELLQIRIDGSPVEPPLSEDDLLGDAPGLAPLSLEPLDADGPPWMLGSALAFVGRGDACAIRIENASASMTHCALLRGAESAHVIDLLGRRTLVNDRPVDGASALLDGDVLTVGQARFTVRLESPASSFVPLVSDFPPSPLEEHGAGRGLALARDTDRERSHIVGIDPREAMASMILEMLGAGRDGSKGEILEVLRQFQADTAKLFEAQLERIEFMNREIATLRQELREHLGPPPVPAEPLRLDLIAPPVAPSGEPTGWLLDRLNALEEESRSTWKGILGKITSSVSHRTPAQSPQSLVSVRREAASDHLA